MFGYKFFSEQGEENFQTPREFQVKAREDLERHVKQLQERGGLSLIEEKKKRRKRRLFGLKSSRDAKPAGVAGPEQYSKMQKARDADGDVGMDDSSSPAPTRRHTVQSEMTYGSSPLRKTVSIDSSSDASSTTDAASIDSAGSYPSIPGSMMSSAISSTLDSMSLFSGNSIAHIYTNSTAPTSIVTNSTYGVGQGAGDGSAASGNSPSRVLSLSQALPQDYSDYYAGDLNVPRFSNGRPVFTKRKLRSWELNDIRSLLIYPEMNPLWQGKIPQVVSPYTGIAFRIQLIPLACPDQQFAECLAHTDIYRESSLELDFRLGTARYIVERARRRHRGILEQNHGVPSSAFDEHNLVGDDRYDAYFKYEWRNIIENYLLNVGIENECRYEFKERLKKLRKLGQKPVSQDNLYKKVLAAKSPDLDEDAKLNVWHDVQKKVYAELEMMS